MLACLQVELAYSQVRGDWEAEATQYQPVMAAALEASSTDNEHQTVGKPSTLFCLVCSKADALVSASALWLELPPGLKPRAKAYCFQICGAI